jgi:AcrR family transcriptional regulator
MDDGQPLAEAKRGRGRPSAGARAAILQAALELIANDGLSQLTTREVAVRAGVSESSVFYHFGDKVGLLKEVVLSGLEPLMAFTSQPAVPGEPPSVDTTLIELATALEGFFDHAMPVFTAVQSDAALRRAFAERLVEGDLGPHRGVQLLARYLDAMAEAGVVRPDVDHEAVALLLLGSCFLRAWYRLMAGGRSDETLPGLHATVRAVVSLLAPQAPYSSASRAE